MSDTRNKMSDTRNKIKSVPDDTAHHTHTPHPTCVVAAEGARLHEPASDTTVSTDGLCAPDPSAAIAQIIGHVPTAWEEIMFGNTQRFVAAYNAWFSY